MKEDESMTQLESQFEYILDLFRQYKDENEPELKNEINGFRIILSKIGDK